MRSLLILTVLAACSGNQPADVDANPAGPMCTKAYYDLCTTEHDCDVAMTGSTSGVCHYFMADNYMICTNTCTPGDNSTCPKDASGTNGTCNMMGLCKPSAPNMCHL
jgi:hypothetical protein